MSLLTLYTLRRGIAENRQGAHLKAYEELHEFLRKLGREQSYDLDFSTRLKFEVLKFFADDPFGRDAQIPSRDDYIYRICAMVDIVEGTEWLGEKEDPDNKSWDTVDRKCKGTWTPLTKFAAGKYKCRPRHFSWWTSYPLALDVIDGAHKIGITTNWVPEECVVLRCPVDFVRANDLAFVPSVIDAFMQMIFHPTKDAISPPYGITIDLNFYPVALVPGIDEVVVREIPVEQIEVLPIYVNKKPRDDKREVLADSPQLGMLLENYYQKL